MISATLRITLGSLIAGALIAAPAASAGVDSCDRSCMTGLVDQYLAALVKHDPAGLPLAKGVRFTENTPSPQFHHTPLAAAAGRGR